MTKQFYDRSAKPLKTLELGETVRIRSRNGTWKRAIVRDKVNGRSYVVETDDGGTFRRNSRDLLKTNEVPVTVPADLAQVNPPSSSGNQPTEQPPSPPVPPSSPRLGTPSTNVPPSQVHTVLVHTESPVLLSNKRTPMEMSTPDTRPYVTISTCIL